MKKLICLLVFVSAVCLSAFALSASVYADNDNFTEKYIEKYLSENRADITSKISDKLDEVNENSVNTVSGTIDIREPFTMPIYRCYYDDVKMSSGDEMYSVISCEDQALGLLKFTRSITETPDGRDEEKVYTDFYYLSESSCRSLSDGISFFYLSREGTDAINDLDGGVSTTGIFSAAKCGKAAGVYYSCDDIYSEEVRNEYENYIGLSGITPDYKLLSDKNNTLTNCGSMMSFDYKIKDTAMKLGKDQLYRIRSKTGEYLTVRSGKFCMSELSDSESQYFTIIKNGKGGYTISPAGEKSSLSCRSGNSIEINTSYYGEYCSVIGVRSGDRFIVLTINKQGKLVFAKYHSDKYDYYTQDWYFEAV